MKVVATEFLGGGGVNEGRDCGRSAAAILWRGRRAAARPTPTAIWARPVDTDSIQGIICKKRNLEAFSRLRALPIKIRYNICVSLY